MKKLVKKIKDTLIYKLVKEKIKTKGLTKELANKVIENQRLIDDREPLLIKIRELTLKVNEYEEILRKQ